MEDKSKVSKQEALDSSDKSKLYGLALDEINMQLSTLEKGIIVPRMSTVLAVLRKFMPHYIWQGFYFAEEKEMVIGPYQGEVTCPNIPYTGVCGTCARKKESLIIPNVGDFPGHIVCDKRAKSEIAVPIVDKAGRVIAVYATSSDRLNAFDDVDRKYLENLMPILLDGELQ
ncbi:GAF domain-containing protein [Candidatus Pacearchaeota archaeon]|nr:GAF domain-containing protein [Candidatus Pacearchaeota archaeon]OIO42685.1 MAG: hypothetical protein AUJ63_02110 [Candidatus Pacearchaeota archaeon CG1_02_35_32]